MTEQQSLTVLVVDDEPLLRWSIGELLRRAGHTVIEAESAGHARKVLRQTQDAIAVVLLDYRLPNSEDLQFLLEIQRRLPRTPVVLMTAYATSTLVARAKDHGVHRVLTKPFDMRVVEAVVIEAHRASRLH
jgi:DNA-binding NtrC family response regulator